MAEGISIGDAVLNLRADLSQLNSDLASAVSSTTLAVRQMAAQSREQMGALTGTIGAGFNTVSTTAASAGEKAGQGFFTRISGGISSAAQGVRRFSTDLLVVGYTLDKIGDAGKDVFTDVISQAADFEQSITNLTSINDLFGAAAERAKGGLEDLAITLGMQTKFTIPEATQVLVDLSQKGFDVVGQKVETIRPIFDLAAASMEGVDKASNAVTSTLNTFGLKLSDAGRVADVFTKTNIKSAATLDFLNISLSFIGPVANASGVKLEEMSAVLGTLADRGLRASTAGTSMRSMLANLINPTSSGTRVIKELGLSMSDVDVKSHGLVGTLEKLRQAGISEEQVFELFGKTAAPAALALLNLEDKTDRTLKATANFTKELTKAKGTAKEIADTQLNTLSGKFGNLKDAVDAAKIKIGEALIPSLKDLTDWAMKIVQSFDDWIGKNKEWVASIGTDVVKSIKDVASGIVEWVKSNKDLIESWGPFLIKFVAFSALVAPLIIGLGGLGFALNGIMLLFAGFTAVLGAILPSIGGLEVGITLLVAGLASIESVRKPVMDFFSGIVKGFQGFGTELDKNESKFGGWGRTIGDKMRGAADAFEFFKEGFTGGLKSTDKGLDDNQTKWVQWGEWAKGFWGGIQTKFMQIWDAVKLNFTQTFAELERVWDSLKSATTAAIDFISSNISSKFLSIPQPIQEAFDRVKNAIMSALEYVRDNVGPIVNTILTYLNPLTSVGALARGIGSWMGGGGFDTTDYSNQAQYLGMGSMAGMGGVEYYQGFVGPSIYGYASGGVAKGGWAMVGEKGAELVNLPSGSRVYSNSDSKDMMGGVTVNVSQLVVREEADVDKIAKSLYDLQKRTYRSRGFSTA